MGRFVSILVSALLLTTLGCSRREQVSDTFYPMGGIPFTVHTYDIPQGVFDEAFGNVKTETERLEELFSAYIAESDVSRLNRDGQADIAPETSRLLRLASELSSKSDGAFDVTVMPLIQWWKFCEEDGEGGRLPTDEELEARRGLVDWRQLSVGTDKAVFKKQGMAVDLGGIAKGFMADRAVTILKKAGLKRGIVDAGGDLVLFNSVGEEPFKVGIKDPLDPDKLFAVLLVDNGAVVTSGCYERHFDIKGKSYCHIVDPRSGRPVESLLSVTVNAEEAATADAIATAVMVLGLEAGKALIRMLPGVEGVFIWQEQGSVRWEITPGLQGKVKVGE